MAAAQKSTSLVDVPPVVPGRSRSPSYIRSVSASQVSTMSSQNNNNNNKPPPVPRNSLIRSKSAQLYQQQQQQVIILQFVINSFRIVFITLIFIVKAGPILPPMNQVKIHHQFSEPSYNNNNNNNMNHLPDAILSEPPSVGLSKSFSFESPNGVRRKIPVTPVLSTGPKKSSHDTLHYRSLIFLKIS